MQLSQLEYLQAVANYGGVRKAARAVHVSPQAVSSAIKKLESEYQIVLLDRSAGGLFCLRRAENLRVVHAWSWHKSTISKSTLNRGTVAFRPTATSVFTPPVFTGGGVFFPKTGTTRLKARTPRFTLMFGISQRPHALNHLCLEFRTRPSHLRNQGTASFLRNTWVKRSSRFFRVQRVINLWAP